MENHDLYHQGIGKCFWDKPFTLINFVKTNKTYFGKLMRNYISLPKVCPKNISIQWSHKTHFLIEILILFRENGSNNSLSSCSKHIIMEIVPTVLEDQNDVALKILTQLSQTSNSRGNSENNGIHVFSRD